MIARARDIEATERESPGGKLAFKRKQLFTCDRTGAPFDMDHVVLPPGKRNFPHHAHAALWELYYIVSGRATIRLDEASEEVGAGASIMCPPGVAHQIINESDTEVVYLVISNDPPFDSGHYPDSGKTFLYQKIWNGQPDEDRGFWSRTEQTYYDGEE